MEKRAPPWPPPVDGVAKEFPPEPEAPPVLVAPACWELPLVRPGVAMGVGAEEPAAPVVEMRGSLIDIALGDDAVKGSGDALVRLEGD